MKALELLTSAVVLTCLMVATPAWSKKPTDMAAADDTNVLPQKLTLCHKNHHTINIASSALPAHEAHGDWVVDDENPCPSVEGDDTGETACVGDTVEDTVTQDDIDSLAALDGPLFDTETQLVYLPQVEVDILGNVLTFAVILQRVNDTDFLVRYVAPVSDPDVNVASVGFDGTSTVAPFDVALVTGGEDAGVIAGVEFTVLPDCSPVQLSVTNFTLPEQEVQP
jgi:hypothetical protein